MGNRPSRYSKAACRERTTAELSERIKRIDEFELDTTFGPLPHKLYMERLNCRDEVMRRKMIAISEK